MWRGVGFGDTRLASNRTVLGVWRRHVMAPSTSSRFIGGMDEWECQESSLAEVESSSAKGLSARIVPLESSSILEWEYASLLVVGSLVVFWILLAVVGRHRIFRQRQVYEQVMSVV